MKKEQICGKRYINLVRCSSDVQTETSIPAQLELLNKEGLGLGGIHVDDVILDGVSGSRPGNRSDLPQLIDASVLDQKTVHAVVNDFGRSRG